MGVNGKFETTVSLTPQKSQVFTIGCLTVCGLSLAACFAFLWTGRNGWEIPLYSSAAAGAMGLLCWILSHRNSDLAGGKSTHLTAAESGLAMTFDARNPPTKQMLLIFSNYVEAIAHRAPLPRSNGLIDSAGNVIVGSEVEANLEVDKLNEVAAQQTEAIERSLDHGYKSLEVSGRQDATAPLYTGEAPIEGVSGSGN
jgi:hypothetical protein